MVLKPFWNYYGGKWRAAPHYPTPQHNTIIEPFAGAAGYSLRYPERQVILVEKYAVVAEMWRFLIAAPSREILNIPCVDAIDDLPSWVPAGGRYLVGFSMNDGTTTPRLTLSAGKKKLREMGRHLQGWNELRRDRVAEQVNHIRHWRIIEGSYESAPDIRATWFVDPPYQLAGKYYACPSTTIDFSDLGAWCRAREGQVMVCENVGANWLPFAPFRVFKTSKANAAGKDNPEALYVQSNVSA